MTKFLILSVRNGSNIECNPNRDVPKTLFTGLPDVITFQDSMQNRWGTEHRAARKILYHTFYPKNYLLKFGWGYYTGGASTWMSKYNIWITGKHKLEAQKWLLSDTSSWNGRMSEISHSRNKAWCYPEDKHISNMSCCHYQKPLHSYNRHFCLCWIVLCNALNILQFTSLVLGLHL